MKKRHLRLADEIRDILAKTIMFELSDSRTREVVITHVKLSSDASLATVYFRFYGSQKREEVEKGLESSRGYLKGSIGHTLEYLRKVPDLKFSYDESVEEGAKVEGLLSKLDREKD